MSNMLRKPTPHVGGPSPPLDQTLPKSHVEYTSSPAGGPAWILHLDHPTQVSDETLTFTLRVHLQNFVTPLTYPRRLTPTSFLFTPS